MNELLNCFKEKEILLLLFQFTIFSFIVVMTLVTSIVNRIIEGVSIFNKSFKEMAIYVLTNHKIDTFIALFFIIASLISLILIFDISGIVYFCIYMFIIAGKIIHHFKYCKNK